MEKTLTKIKALLATGFFHIVGSSVINKIIAFLSSVVLIRILTKTEYGAFTYAWNIYSIVLVLNGMGIESGVLQLASERGGDPEYTDQVSRFGARFGLWFNGLLVAVLLWIGLFAPMKIQAGRPLLCALCALPVFQLLFHLMLSYLRAQKRNQEYARLQVTHTILVFAACAVCAFLFREMGMVMGHYIACIAACLVGLVAFRIRLILPKASELRAEDRKPLLKISFISMLNNGLSQMMYLLDVFVLGIVDPQETILASYKVATLIPAALTFIPLSLVVYLYPYFAEHRGDGAWCLRRYKQILLGLGGLNLVISAVLFFGAPLIVKLFFGAAYLDAVPVFRLLSVNYFFSGTFRILSGNLLVTQRKLKFNLLVAILACSLNVVADYFFITWWGAMGAAIATCSVVLLTSVMNTAYLVYTFRKNGQSAAAALPGEGQE